MTGRHFRLDRLPVLPAPLQIVASALAGLVLALAAYSQFEHGRSPFGRTLWVPVLYQGLLVTPALLYLGLVHPSWNWMYLVDPDRLPLGTTLLSVVACAVVLLGGYLGGWALLRARHRQGLAALVVVATLGLMAALVMLRARLGAYGTFAEWRAGLAAPLAERKLGWSLGFVGGGLLVGLLLAARFLVAQGERDREG